VNILLSEEGIFPITKNKEGVPLKKMPNTGMSLSGTIQGEGLLAGTPSLFIRLAGCNLRCIWDKGNNEYSICDTPDSVFGKIKTVNSSINDIVDIIRHNLGNIKHIVITGGEPTLQAKPLALLCNKLKDEFKVHITLETNGTIFDEIVAKHIDLFSISPKLTSTNPDDRKLKKFGLTQTDIHKNHNLKRKNIKAIQSFINLTKKTNKSFQLKFVVTKPEDAKEIKDDYLNNLSGWSNDNIFIMPLGATREELKIFTPVALEMAITNGWRFSPRMHIQLFNERLGV